jgi:hypothetical protein
MVPLPDGGRSIWPGHRFARNVAQLGSGPLEEPREGGECKAREWLRLLKARRQFVAVADWNNFQEETWRRARAAEPAFQRVVDANPTAKSILRAGEAYA